MLAFMIIIAVVLVAPSEEMREFSRHSNGVAAYEFVTSTPCESGLRRSGYAYAPSSKVYLKQKNLDGTVTMPVCED